MAASEIASMYVSIGARLSPFNRAMGTLQQKVRGAASGISGGLGGALAVLGGNLMTSAVQGVMQLGQSLLGVGKQAVDLAGDFQEQMAILSIAAKSSGLSFEDLKGAAIAVGGDVSLLGVSASGAADAMSGLYKAGLTSTEIFGDLQGYMAGTADLGGALRAAIDLAAASELDMVQASDLAAVALATFGGELETESERAEFITKAMNNMVQAADASVAEVSDLAAALRTIGPTAAAFGFSLEDTNNALALLSTRGIAGAEAGTALKSMLTNMMRQTSAVQDAWTELGISLYDSEGQMRDLPAVIGDMNKAMAGMTEEQRNQYIQTLAGTYGMKALNTLLAEGAQGWEDMAIATANAAGIQEQAGARAATFKGQMEALEGTLETLWIGIGDALLPTLTELTSWFSGFVSEHGPAIAATFGQIVDVITDVIGAFMSGAPGDFPWEDIFPPWLANIAYAVAGAFETVVGVIQGLASGDVSLADLIPPGLLELGQTILTYWQAIAGVFTGLWAIISENVVKLLPILTEIGAGVLNALGTVWQTALKGATIALQWFAEKVLPVVGEAIGKVTDWIVQNWPQIKATAQEVWGAVLSAIQAAGTWITTTLVPTLQEVWTWLQTNIPQAIETLKGFWQDTLLPAIETVWTFITESLIPVFEKIVEWMKTTIPPAIEALKKAWEEVLLPAIEKVWGFITDDLIPLFEDVKEWLATTLTEATETLSKIWEETLKPALETVWKFIQEHLIPLFKAVGELFEVTLTTILTAFAGLWENVLKPAIKTVWTFLKENLIPIFNKLKNTIWTFLKPKIEWLQGFLDDKLKPALDGIGSAIDKVTGWIETLKEKIENITLPDWLTPGSPTPFEIGLLGIAAAGEKLARNVLPAVAGGFKKIEGNLRSVEAVWDNAETRMRAMMGAPMVGAELYGRQGGKVMTPFGLKEPIPTAPMRKATGGGGVRINININDKLVVRDPADIDMIADALVRRLRLRGGPVLGAHSLG